jgi:hypothetical protein
MFSELTGLYKGIYREWSNATKLFSKIVMDTIDYNLILVGFLCYNKGITT